MSDNNSKNKEKNRKRSVKPDNKVDYAGLHKENIIKK